MYIDYAVLGKRVKRARLEADITQELLAEKINKTNEYISKIENGKAKPSLEVLAAICHVLKIDIGYVLSGTLYESPNYMKNDVFVKINSCTPEQKKLIFELTDRILEYNVNKK